MALCLKMELNDGIIRGEITGRCTKPDATRSTIKGSNGLSIKITQKFELSLPVRQWGVVRVSRIPKQLWSPQGEC